MRQQPSERLHTRGGGWGEPTGGKHAHLNSGRWVEISGAICSQFAARGIAPAFRE